MKLLAFDTSSDLLSVALAEEKDKEYEVKASLALKAVKQHGQTLAPTINSLLGELGWLPADVQGLIVGVGPGSYTGLRVGMTFAKVWANAKEIPLYTVSSLALMAASQANQSADSLLFPIMDARRQTAYTALYRSEGDQLVNVRQDRHIDYKEWLDLIKNDLEGVQRVYLIGQEIESFVRMTKEKFREKDIHVIDNWQASPHVERAFVHLKLDQVKDIDLAVPNYGHATLAEKEWLERERQAGYQIDKANEDLIDHYN